MAPSYLAVGTVGGEQTSFPAPHRDSNSTAITTSVVLMVPMSHEDVEAALWLLVRDEGVTIDELADDGDARWLLLDSILGRGVAAIESYRLDLAALSPSDPAYPTFLQLRARVDALLGPRTGRQLPTSRASDLVPPDQRHRRSAELTAAAVR